MTNKPSAFPPRVWIDLMMYAEGGSKYYAHQRPYGSAPEYLSVTEHEHLASERARRAREEGRAEAVRHVNAVQRLLAGRLPQGESWQFLTEAWNLNAKFLSDNFDAQSKYLDGLASRAPTEKGGE